MIHIVIAMLVVGILGYMFWRVAVPMRHDRIMYEREATRGKYAFSRMHRARFLLGKAFQPASNEPKWQRDLRRMLDGSDS